MEAGDVGWSSLEKQRAYLHTCDNPPRVRQSHLFTGTLSDNTQDMIRKGRARFAGKPFKPPISQ
jgi:hypothetical protein